jgi:hypothetical protein
MIPCLKIRNYIMGRRLIYRNAIRLAHHSRIDPSNHPRQSNHSLKQISRSLHLSSCVFPSALPVLGTTVGIDSTTHNSAVIASDRARGQSGRRRCWGRSRLLLISSNTTVRPRRLHWRRGVVFVLTLTAHQDGYRSTVHSGLDLSMLHRDLRRCNKT